MKLTRRAETIIWAASALTALVCGVVTVQLSAAGASFGETMTTFRVDFLDDTLGMVMTVLVLTNFGLAFAAVTPMAKIWMQRPIAREHPQMVFAQFFLMAVALFETCAVLALVYAAIAEDSVRAPHSLQLIALPLCLVGLVKFLWVDAPEVRELVNPAPPESEGEPRESAGSAPPPAPEETPQSSPQ